MRALIYKEFKLAMHPLCYVFVFLFPFLVLVPSYPLCIGFIYVLSCYPILFLGANKGQQSNDLLFSTLLPVRKKDVVLARIITVLTMQFVFIFLMIFLAPFAAKINEMVAASGSNAQQDSTVIGLGVESILTVVSIGIICFSLADLIYFSIYYKNGKSIVLSTLLTILGFVFALALLSIVLPYFEPIKTGFFDVIDNNYLYKFIMIMSAVLFSAGMHFLTYKIASKKLEKVDL